ncbi:MAG TPA: hypothetical protein VKE70_01970, partial [Candidatus Solibacter sp.]|nr:hypothetical protein [Candidatus Solibacter sp.]
MKTFLPLVVAVLIASAAAAQEHAEHDHLAMLRAYLAAHSSHGPVIPQPDTVNAAATKTFNIVARSFTFDISPSNFVANQ